MRGTFQVFLASNFEEFSPLRARLRDRIDGFPVLPLRCIDLNNGRARHETPLRVSLDTVRRSDFLILLVGRTYGGQPHGEDKSYAHLEYQAALAAGDQIVILPYLYGWESREEFLAAPEAKLASWGRTLDLNHTLRLLPGDTDVEVVADSVLLDIQAAVFDLLTEGQRRALDALDAQGGTLESGPSREELERLASALAEEEETISRGDEPHLSLEEALRSPARMAALEQREQAFRALDLGERAVAVGHLRRALELMPLDADAGYWLARLLVMTGRRQACQEAEELARRAAKLAESEGRRLYAAASLLVASRAAARLEEHDRAVLAARGAVEAAGWYAAAHAELGTRLAEAGDFEQGLQSISDAFFRHPSTALRVLRREPIFHQSPAQVRPYLSKLERRVREAVAEVLDVEMAIERAPFSEGGRDSSAAERAQDALQELSTAGILKQLALSRESVTRQLNLFRASLQWVREVLSQHRRMVASAKADLEALSRRHGSEETHLAAERPKLGQLAATGLLGIFLGLAAPLSPPEVDVLFAIVLLTLLGRFVFPWRSWMLSREELRRRHPSELEEAESALTRALEERDAATRSVKQELGPLLDAFETAALRWSILSPTRGIGTARRGDLLRLDPAQLPEGYKLNLDQNQLPPDLQELIVLPRQHDRNRFHLFRVKERSGNSISAARWAAFADDTIL